MRMKLKNYNFGYQVVSLAFDENVKDYLLDKDLNVLFVNENEIILYPMDIQVSSDLMEIEVISNFNNYDVLEIWENGIVSRIYNDKSVDNYFFITNACNSNCIICPSPDSSRKFARDNNLDSLYEMAKHIPSDTPHLTITGGEPFLIGERIFPFIEFLKNKFTRTEFLFLTNGRIFSIDKYLDMFVDSIPAYSIVAIPIHGSCSDVHDLITRAENSFEQTKLGIKKLLKNNIPVEVRLVVNRLNIDDFDNIANLIIDEFNGIEYVSVIAMEMTGNAWKNRNDVWISYRESFDLIKHAINKIIKNGIDVRLYNFPLCTVDSSFWTICEKSISSNKIKYKDDCDFCKYKKNCGGVFNGTYKLEKEELNVIL